MGNLFNSVTSWGGLEQPAAIKISITNTDNAEFLETILFTSFSLLDNVTMLLQNGLRIKEILDWQD
jgi:hypothetical protein